MAPRSSADPAVRGLLGNFGSIVLILGFAGSMGGVYVTVNNQTTQIKLLGDSLDKVNTTLNAMATQANDIAGLKAGQQRLDNRQELAKEALSALDSSFRLAQQKLDGLAADFKERVVDPANRALATPRRP